MAEEALKKFPKNPRLHHILAGSYLFGFKNPDKAIELYEKAIKLDPNDVRIWLGYGESFFELKDGKSREKGIKILTECIKRFPKYHIAYIVLAEEYQYMGNYKKAAELLEASIHLDPAYYRAYSIIGDMLVSRGRYAEAMEYYRRTIKTNPVYEALVFIKVGELYRILGDDQNAEKYYWTALDVHKGNDEQNQEKAMAYLELSRLASDRGDYKQADTFIKQAFDSFPRYEYNHYYQALLYLDLKEYGKAEKALSNCRSAQTEESMDQYEIDYGRAQIASARGDQKAAVKFLTKAVDSENNYAKVEIVAKAEKDKHLKDLRKTADYGKLKDRVGEIGKKLPPFKLNKDLLDLWQ
jgi:tetratricopeptide (TPR) repeat protein